MFNPNLKSEYDKEIKKAVDSGSFFITITSADPSGNKKLNHFYIRNNFPTEDLLPSLEHISEQIRKDEKL